MLEKSEKFPAAGLFSLLIRSRQLLCAVGISRKVQMLAKKMEIGQEVGVSRQKLGRIISAVRISKKVHMLAKK